MTEAELRIKTTRRHLSSIPFELNPHEDRDFVFIALSQHLSSPWHIVSAQKTTAYSEWVPGSELINLMEKETQAHSYPVMNRKVLSQASLLELAVTVLGFHIRRKSKSPKDKSS